jgi:uncharacterized damage-inducible protein DinB
MQPLSQSRKGNLSLNEGRGLMNYYAAKELAESFRTVRKNTIISAQDVPEEKFAFRAAPDTRSVGELLAHIALSYNFQYQVHAVERRTTLVGFDFPSMIKRLTAEEKEPRTKDQILDMLRTSGEKWAGWMQGLTDDFLAEQVQMPPGMTPPSKSRFEMILSVKEHEMHHRGQLMLIERVLGIVPHMTREMQARFAAAAAASTAKT